MKLAVFSTLVLTLGLAACSTASVPRPSLLPGIPAKSATRATTGGAGVLTALGNGLLGSAVSRLDSSDRRKALEAEYKALEYARAGDATSWKGDDASGEVVAAQPYQVGSQNCRQYTHTFTIDGAPQTARGTACRNPDGSWTPLT
jgi:surface antigen